MMGYDDCPPYKGNPNPVGVMDFESLGLKPSGAWAPPQKLRPDDVRQQSVPTTQEPPGRFRTFETLD